MPWPIAYQLYSSRNFPPLPVQFALLKSMGYDAIEPWLPAYESDPKLFRRQLDDALLACYGFHMPLAGLVNDTNRFIDIALTLGANLMIPPWVAPEERQPTIAYWRSLGHQLAEGAAKANPHGLTVAWHNHDFEYIPLPDGTRPIDHIFDAAGPEVKFEIDLGWLTRARADPATELSRYANRIAAIQTKDTVPLGTAQDDGWTATGDGTMDWPALFPLFAQTTATHIVTEHDNPSDWQIFAKRSIDCLRRIGV